ncbi:hypothetical protein F5B21DRAFT_524181 [Xylaria acuta]|nr:hypothetical protein F5B21DRAFT_524181 [Xylaria acuta]
MSSHEIKQQALVEHNDASSDTSSVECVNKRRERKRHGYFLDRVQSMLARGLDLNFQSDEPKPKPRPRGCVIYGVDPNRCWAYSNTSLHESMENRWHDIAALLLKNGAQIDLRNALGRTALHEAIRISDYAGVKFLVENGANVDATSEERSIHDPYLSRHLSSTTGVAPLHEAIKACDFRMVELLVDMGANVAQRNGPVLDLLYRHGGRLSEVATPSEAILPTNPRKMAQMLLASANVFPPSSCRGVYLQIIDHPEFLQAWSEYSINSTSACVAPFKIFLDLLAQKAQRPNPEDVPGAPKCLQCSKLLKQLSPTGPEHFVLHPDRDSLRQSANGGCYLCAIFEDALIHKSGKSKWEVEGRPPRQEESTKVIIQTAFPTITSDFTITTSGFTMTVYCDDQAEVLSIHSISDSFMIDHQQFPNDRESGTGSPQAFKFARAWLENCRLHHPICSGKKDENPVLPTRVIDVGGRTAEPFLYESNNERAPYLTLSYCWGRGNNLRTTMGSLQNHKRLIPFDSFPPTLRDAVLATRQLGFRYLWIDALCIVQDDLNDWETEAGQMRDIYSNATITLSAHESEDAMGGMFRPRPDEFVGPVQLSLHVPKRYRLQQPAHQTIFSILPVNGERRTLQPGPIDSRGWTLQENVMSTRVVHWGPGILYWECLSCHGSESDPDGRIASRNLEASAKSMGVRRQKGILQGLPYEKKYSNDYLGDDGQSSDDQTVRSEDSDNESEDWDESPAQQDKSNQDQGSEENRTSDCDESLCSDDIDEEDDVEKLPFREWQNLVTQYSSRKLTNPQDKIPAFLGLSRAAEAALQDEFLVGIWKNSHFFPSLLWSTQQPGGRSRNRNYPSWTWASIDGRVWYSKPSRVRWEPSDVAFDVKVSGPSQNQATGSITMRTTVRKFSRHYKFWRYKNELHNPFLSYSFRREYGKAKSKKNLSEELMVVNGCRDLRAVPLEEKKSTGWEGAENDIYFAVIARVGKQPPPKVGYPAFPQGKPRSLMCLCLTPVNNDNQTQAEVQPKIYRRVGFCEIWDHSEFWEGAVKDEWLTII